MCFLKFFHYSTYSRYCFRLYYFKSNALADMFFSFPKTEIVRYFFFSIQLWHLFSWSVKTIYVRSQFNANSLIMVSFCYSGLNAPTLGSGIFLNYSISTGEVKKWILSISGSIIHWRKSKEFIGWNRVLKKKKKEE